MTGQLIIGAAAQRRPAERHVTDFDYERMKDNGIEWVRLGIRVPFLDETMTSTSPAFDDQQREIDRIASHGMKMMAITPFPAGDPDIGGGYPEWGGRAGSEGHAEHYEAVCRWLGERFAGVAAGWQVANEMNAAEWSGGLTVDSATRFMRRGGRGLKKGAPGAMVGFNMAGFDDSARALYWALFADDGADGFEWDYIGCDGYMAPDLWPEAFAFLKTLSDKPIVVQEFGYASAGITLTAEQTKAHPFTSPHDRCKWLGWPLEWEGHGHTPTDQEEYVARCMEQFLAEPRVAGVIFWRWDDAPYCWLCGRPSEICPGAGRWGLVDQLGNPKPSLDAFRAGAEKLRQR